MTVAKRLACLFQRVDSTCDVFPYPLLTRDPEILDTRGDFQKLAYFRGRNSFCQSKSDGLDLPTRIVQNLLFEFQGRIQHICGFSFTGFPAGICPDVRTCYHTHDLHHKVKAALPLPILGQHSFPFLDI